MPALKAPLLLDDLGRKYKEALALLAHAWDNPDDLGFGSKIHGETIDFYSDLIQHATPAQSADEIKAQELMLECLKTAWWAVWRARDYSAAALERRVAGTPVQTPFENLFRNMKMAVGDTEFYYSHVPKFDRSMNRVEFPASYRQNGVNRLVEFPDLVEGVVLNPSFNSFPDLPKGQKLQWSFIAEFSDKFPPTENCWVANSQGISQFDIEGCIFAAPVSISMTTQKLEFDQSRFESGLTIQRPDALPIKPEQKLTIVDDVEFGRGLVLTNVSVSTNDTFLNNYIFDAEGLDPTQIQTGFGLKKIKISGASNGGSFVVRSGSISPYLPELKFEEVSASAGRKKGHIASFSVIDAKIGELVINTLLPTVLRVSESAINKAEVSVRQTSRIEIDASDIRHLFQECVGKTRLSIESSKVENLRSQVDGEITVNLSDVAIKSRCIIDASYIERFSWDRGTLGPDSTSRMSGISLTLVKGKDTETTVSNFTLKSVTFYGSVRLNGLKFTEGFQISRCHFYEVPTIFGSSFSFDLDVRQNNFYWLETLGKIASRSDSKPRDELLAVSESRFRTWAKRLGEINDRYQEAFFNSEAMKARHMRGDVPWSDKLISKTYDGLCRYGASYIRPLLVWTVLVFAITMFASLYQTNHVLSGEQARGTIFASSFAFALSLMIRPFYPIDPAVARAASAQPDPTPIPLALSQDASRLPAETGLEFAAHLADHYGGLFTFFGMILNIAGLTLIFLTLLALRRKFQLS